MGQRISNFWNFTKRIYRGQEIETASATLLGIGVSFEWLRNSLPHWIAIYFWPTVIACKAIFISTVSSFATNYISYQFKKRMDEKSKRPPRKGRKRAA